jgi:hypothetical protein
VPQSYLLKAVKIVIEGMWNDGISYPE